MMTGRGVRALVEELRRQNGGVLPTLSWLKEIGYVSIARGVEYYERLYGRIGQQPDFGDGPTEAEVAVALNLVEQASLHYWGEQTNDSTIGKPAS